MTEYTAPKLMELKKRLKEHGYYLEKVTHFKNHDRIHFSNENINITINLRSTVSQIALDALIEACVGKVA